MEVLRLFRDVPEFFHHQRVDIVAWADQQRYQSDARDMVSILLVRRPYDALEHSARQELKMKIFRCRIAIMEKLGQLMRRQLLDVRYERVWLRWLPRWSLRCRVCAPLAIFGQTPADAQFEVPSDDEFMIADREYADGLAADREDFGEDFAPGGF